MGMSLQHITCFHPMTSSHMHTNIPPQPGPPPTQREQSKSSNLRCLVSWDLSHTLPNCIKQLTHTPLFCMCPLSRHHLTQRNTDRTTLGLGF